MLEKGFTAPNLAEPALPGSPSWFPLPPGWIVLGILVLLAGLTVALFRYARWRRNVWRRQALSALSQSHTADSWLLLIKRILLVHHQREAISAASNPTQWLQQIPLDDALREQLSLRYCQRENQLNDDDNARLRAQLHAWIERLPYV
ncbi:DUF4381 domain-containing protein [Klebsiella michiganensis]